MSLDYFITIEKVAEEAGYTIEGVEKLCRKHGVGVRDYDNENNEGIEDTFDMTFKYKGMMASDYVDLFSSL